MLNEMSQSQKTSMILLIRGAYGSQTHRGKKQNRGCQGLRQGDGELLLNGHGVSDLQDERVLEISFITRV